MKEIVLTNGAVTLVDDEDYAFLSKFKWHLGKNGYAIHSGTGMHRVIMKMEFGDRRVVDHIDGNGLNNQRSNLRIATFTQNAINRPRRITNRSGYKGVDFNKKTGKWMARIGIHGKTFYLGLHPTPEEAYAAYCRAAENLHGEFANLGVRCVALESSSKKSRITAEAPKPLVQATLF